MSSRPVIFLSAVSKELKTARGRAARLIHRDGFDPKDQDMARTEHGSLRAVLCRWIDDSAGVIQLVGKCYGAEPREPDGVTPKPDPEFGRVSYTQFEALYAKKCGKPVWYFFVADGFTPDPHVPEPPELSDLQEQYHQRIRSADDIRHRFANDAELENCIHRIHDHLNELRREWEEDQRRARRFRRLAGAGIVVLLALGISGLQLGWLVKKDTTKTKQTVIRVEGKVDALPLAVAEAIQRTAADAVTSGGKDDGTRRTVLFAELEKKYGLPAGTLAAELPEMARKRAEDAAIPRIDRAKAAYAALDYAEAERLAMGAAAEERKAVPLDKHKLIEALDLAGRSASRRRADRAAVAHFTDAAKLTDKNGNPLEWARVHYGLAFALDDQGEFEQAADLLKNVVLIGTDKMGPEHPDTLKSRGNLASTLQAQGKHAEAEKEYRAVFKIMEHKLGTEHPDTLMCRDNLANALNAQGNHAEAEHEHRAVWKIRERVLGPEHPDTLASRNNLAAALDDQGKYAEAEQENRAVLKIRVRVLGAEHPETLQTQMNLANALLAQGKHVEAEQVNRAVLSVQERVLGVEHPDTLTSRNNLVATLGVQGKYAEAEDEGRAVLDLQERVLGAEHPETLKSRMNLAISLDAQGAHVEAERELRAIFEVRERVLGAEHPDVFQSAANLALCLENQRKLPEALAFMHRAEQGWTKVLGPNHPHTKLAKEGCERIKAALKR